MDLSKFQSLDVIMICGNYGSGKSHFARANFKDTGRLRISRSEIRKHIYEMMHYGDPWSPDFFNEEDEVLVKHIERKTLEHFEFHKKKVIIDGTFTTAKSRAWIVKIVKDMKKTIGIIFLKTPVEKCMERNKLNPIKVPERIILNINLKMELPAKAEGFDQVLVVKDY